MTNGWNASSAKQIFFFSLMNLNFTRKTAIWILKNWPMAILTWMNWIQCFPINVVKIKNSRLCPQIVFTSISSALKYAIFLLFLLAKILKKRAYGIMHPTLKTHGKSCPKSETKYQWLQKMDLRPTIYFLNSVHQNKISIGKHYGAFHLNTRYLDTFNNLPTTYNSSVLRDLAKMAIEFHLCDSKTSKEKVNSTFNIKNNELVMFSSFGNFVRTFLFIHASQISLRNCFFCDLT